MSGARAPTVPRATRDVPHDPPLPTLDGIAAFLHNVLGAEAYPPDERGGVYRAARDADPTTRAITRLGFALEPWPGLRAWAVHEACDALFIHRPWRLAPGVLAPTVGVLYAHLPFDEHLTTGDNAPLAAALGFRGRESLGAREGRALGMLGEITPRRAADVVAQIAVEFGGTEAVVVPDPAASVSRVAVAGAMSDALAREAVARGAGVYVTGQLRAPARAAVAATGIAVVATGHARAEAWGLRALADHVQRQWSTLHVSVAPPHRLEAIAAG